MKCYAALAAFVATGAYAQIDVVKGSLSDVRTGIQALGNAANSFDGNIDPVKSKADALVATIKKGDSAVQASSPLDLQGALGLTDPVQGLTKDSQALADGFKARRSDVQKANACKLVRSTLAAIDTNSKSFIKTVISKVPTEAQPIAQQLAAGLTKVLVQAESDFSESECKDDGTAITPGGSTSPAASQSSAATQTSAATRTSAAKTTAAASSSPAASVGTTLIPSSSTAPKNGTSPISTAAPVPAGAAFVAPAGALVMAVAAALL